MTLVENHFVLLHKSMLLSRDIIAIVIILVNILIVVVLVVVLMVLVMNQVVPSLLLVNVTKHITNVHVHP